MNNSKDILKIESKLDHNDIFKSKKIGYSQTRKNSRANLSVKSNVSLDIDKNSKMSQNLFKDT